MALFFDTSIVIAGTVAAHPQHHRALPWLQQAYTHDVRMVISSHVIAESFAVLTKLPVRPRMPASTAVHILTENIISHATIIELTQDDYTTVLARMNQLNLSGGIIYDALLLQAARKANCDALITLNEKDFVRLYPEKPGYIMAP